MRGSVAAYLISSATCGAITADQLQAQARAGTRFNLAPATGAVGTFSCSNKARSSRLQRLSAFMPSPPSPHNWRSRLRTMPGTSPFARLVK